MGDAEPTPGEQLHTTMRYELVDRNAQRAGDDSHQLTAGLQLGIASYF
jgi:hypothetical protein